MYRPRRISRREQPNRRTVPSPARIRTAPPAKTKTIALAQCPCPSRGSFRNVMINDAYPHYIIIQQPNPPSRSRSAAGSSSNAAGWHRSIRFFRNGIRSRSSSSKAIVPKPSCAVEESTTVQSLRKKCRSSTGLSGSCHANTLSCAVRMKSKTLSFKRKTAIVRSGDALRAVRG